MTDHYTKFRVVKFVKIVFFSLSFVLLVLFVIATVRTLTLDVNADLQLAHWEKTNNIASDLISEHREELLDNFKGEQLDFLTDRFLE